MANSKSGWTNQDILNEFLRMVVEDCYHWSSEAVTAFREDATDDDLDRLKDRLGNVGIGVVASLFGIIDRNSGPSDWPGVKLVNAQTGEVLSQDLQWELSRVEGEYFDTTAKRQ